MKFRQASSEDIKQIMTLLPNDIIDKSRFKNLNKLLKEKGIISQVIESEEKNIIGVSLGYTKKLLQKSYFKQDKIIAHLLATIQYDFIFFDIFKVGKQEQNKGFERMLIYSFLDECKGKTIIAAIPEDGKEELIKYTQITFMRFDQIAQITINNANYLIYEKDN
ncbi:hypothetical protein HOC01_06690 [archaeon]|nr:hypothetical protein [archaeon]MBT6697472.1 hypothetical protein [archaeon]